MPHGPSNRIALCGVSLLLALLFRTSSEAEQVLLSGADGRPVLRFGADEQFRPLEHHSRLIWYTPDYGPAESGPPVDCVRFRERVWLLWEPDVDWQLGLRLAHRNWYYLSRPGPNNYKRGTWRFPDEVIVDNLQFTWGRPERSGPFVRVGRFDLTEGGAPVFGNGLIIADGTSLDGGRSSYFDGVLGGWRSEDKADQLRVGLFYLDWKDRTLVINDVQRALLPGNCTVALVEWRHRVSESLTVAPYLFEDAVSDHQARKENGHIGVAGLRFSGVLAPGLDYSADFARQFGHYQAGVVAGPLLDCEGAFADLRLNRRLPDWAGTALTLRAEYTWFSGDDPRSTGSYEGWHPLFALNMPLFREECYYTLNKGLWTNLHHLQLQLEAVLRKGDPRSNQAGRLSLVPGWTSLWADRHAGSPGGGSHYGEMPSLFFDWQSTRWLKLTLLGGALIPGDYYRGGGLGEWLRAELLFTY